LERGHKIIAKVTKKLFLSNASLSRKDNGFECSEGGDNSGRLSKYKMFQNKTMKKSILSKPLFNYLNYNRKL
jgi:hypothetical protein